MPIFLLAGSFAFAAQTVVVRGYYAMQNTLFPALFSSLAVVLSIPLYVYGMHFLGISGVALAVSLSAIFQVMLLYALLKSPSTPVVGLPPARTAQQEPPPESHTTWSSSQSHGSM